MANDRITVETHIHTHGQPVRASSSPNASWWISGDASSVDRATRAESHDHHPLSYTLFLGREQVKHIIRAFAPMLGWEVNEEPEPKKPEQAHCADCGHEDRASLLLDTTRGTVYSGTPLCEACMEARDLRAVVPVPTPRFTHICESCGKDASPIHRDCIHCGGNIVEVASPAAQ